MLGPNRGTSDNTASLLLQNQYTFVESSSDSECDPEDEDKEDEEEMNLSEKEEAIKVTLN